MKAFRKLAKNILFKFVLGIVALSFVLFGVAEFVTGMPNSWIIKVGDEKIGLKTFQQAVELDKKIIRSAKGSSPEIEQYLVSNKFNQDVSNRLARRLLIEKISQEIGASGSKKLILKTVADDSNFQTTEGKFDHEKFKKFLANNGIDEDRYVKEVNNEISAEMIIGSIGMVSPVNFKNAVELEVFNQEKRVADTIYLSKNIIKDVASPNNEEIQKYYNENSQQFKTPEYREISYIEIDSKSFEQNVLASDEEINKFYKDNLQTAFTQPESKDFLHISFDDEKSALEFQKKIQATDVNDLKNNFIKLAKTDRQKKLEEITLKNITKNSLPPIISEAVNQVKINELSKIVKSEIGFHLFLLTNINPQRTIELAEVKNKISEKIIFDKKSKIAQENITKINDMLMIAKSLDEIANKYQLKVINVPSVISASGLSKDNLEIAETKKFGDFSKNAFSVKQNQPSKLFPINDNKFYALEVKKIIPSYQPEISEVKNLIIEKLLDQRKQDSLAKLAKQIHQEISENVTKANEIISKYGLKLERNKTFPRDSYIDFGGNKIANKNQFIDNVFDTAIGKATPLSQDNQNEFMFAIVRNIITAELSPQEIVETKKRAVEIFASDIMMEYNDYLQKKYPIEINKKFFSKNS